MPRPYPKEFREDVIAVTRRREAGVTASEAEARIGAETISVLRGAYVGTAAVTNLPTTLFAGMPSGS